MGTSKLPRVRPAGDEKMMRSISSLENWLGAGATDSRGKLKKKLDKIYSVIVKYITRSSDAYSEAIARGPDPPDPGSNKNPKKEVQP